MNTALFFVLLSVGAGLIFCQQNPEQERTRLLNEAQRLTREANQTLNRLRQDNASRETIDVIVLTERIVQELEQDLRRLNTNNAADRARLVTIEDELRNAENTLRLILQAVEANYEQDRQRLIQQAQDLIKRTEADIVRVKAINDTNAQRLIPTVVNILNSTELLVKSLATELQNLNVSSNDARQRLDRAETELRQAEQLLTTELQVLERYLNSTQNGTTGTF